MTEQEIEALLAELDRLVEQGKESPVFYPNLSRDERATSAIRQLRATLGDTERNLKYENTLLQEALEENSRLRQELESYRQSYPVVVVANKLLDEANVKNLEYYETELDSLNNEHIKNLEAATDHYEAKLDTLEQERNDWRECAQRATDLASREVLDNSKLKLHEQIESLRAANTTLRETLNNAADSLYAVNSKGANITEEGWTKIASDMNAAYSLLEEK